MRTLRELIPWANALNELIGLQRTHLEDEVMDEGYTATHNHLAPLTAQNIDNLFSSMTAHHPHLVSQVLTTKDGDLVDACSWVTETLQAGSISQPALD